jgi:acyl-CoA reductase-like NAD-dependent aldehyde dehydrogenase
MLIDGELVEAESGKRFDNINPTTEEVLGPSGGRGEVPPNQSRRLARLSTELISGMPDARSAKAGAAASRPVRLAGTL